MSAVPVHKPIIVPKPRPELRVEQGVKPAVGTNVLTRSIAFCVLTLSIYFVSSLSGQVMVEKARREGLSAVTRAKDAVKEEAMLREKVQALTRASAVDTWAEENGFVAPEALSAQVPADSDAEKSANAQADQ